MTELTQACPSEDQTAALKSSDKSYENNPNAHQNPKCQGKHQTKKINKVPLFILSTILAFHPWERLEFDSKQLRREKEKFSKWKIISVNLNCWLFMHEKNGPAWINIFFHLRLIRRKMYENVPFHFVCISF